MNSPKLPDGDRVHRIATVAEMLTLSVKSNRRMIDRGDLPAIKLGGTLLIRESSVQALLAKATLKL